MQIFWYKFRNYTLNTKSALQLRFIKCLVMHFICVDTPSTNLVHSFWGARAINFLEILYI